MYTPYQSKPSRKKIAVESLQSHKFYECLIIFYFECLICNLNLHIKMYTFILFKGVKYRAKFLVCDRSQIKPKGLRSNPR